MKLLLIFVMILALLSLSFIVYNNLNLNIEIEKSEPQELTANQTIKMIQLGAIIIETDIEYTDGDKSINILFKTQNGDCYLHQDIFGRYYCRWKQ